MTMETPDLIQSPADSKQKTTKARRAPSPWPALTPRDMDAFYGRLEWARHTAEITESWKSRFLKVLPLPFSLRLVHAPDAWMRKVQVHKAVAGSLADIFGEILAYYGTPTDVTRAGMDIVGETFMPRPDYATGLPSAHCYGAAITLAPGINRPGRPWEKGMIDMEVVKMFQARGWVWGGEFETPFCGYFGAHK